jgi:hypothetical protein
MATVVPNSANQSMRDLSQMLVQIMLENKRLALDAQRVGIQREQVDLERERTQQAAQGQALDRLMTIAPFLPRGKTIAEIPQIHGAMQTAFPEFDPTSPGDLGGVVLNEETIDTLLRPMVIERFRQLPEDEQARMMERATNRAILGTPSSGEELAAQDTRAQIYLESWQNLRQDPVALESILRTNMGLDPIIRVQYGDQTLEFDTQGAASLTTALMQHRDQMSLGWANYSLRQQEINEARAARQGAGQLDLAGELMAQMEKHGVSLGRASAMQIVRAYDETARLSQGGTLSDQNNPLRRLFESSPTEVQAAIQVFDGAAQFGENQSRLFFQQTPEGQQLLRFLELGEQLNNAGIPRENIPGLLENITESFRGTGQGGYPMLPQYQEPGFRGNRLNFRGPEAPATVPSDTGPTARNTPSPQATAETMRADARALAEGRITTRDLQTKYSDPLARAAVIRQSRLYRRQ